MIERQLQRKKERSATNYPFVLITGPRRSGKSTLAGETTNIDNITT